MIKLPKNKQQRYITRAISFVLIVFNVAADLLCGVFNSRIFRILLLTYNTAVCVIVRAAKYSLSIIFKLRLLHYQKNLF